MRMIDADALLNDMKCLWDWETVDGIQTSTALRQVMTDIRNAHTVGGWVSVKDRLPEDGQEVVARITGDNEVVTFHASNKGWYGVEVWYQNDCVTHWMPLPEPPEEGDNG